MGELMNQPLIILGMHRSGTSMLTRILRQQGVFLGDKIQGDDEALFFLYLNRWMLRMAGTDWDRPVPALEMLEDAVHVERLADYAQSRLSGLQTRSYFGSKLLTAKMRISTDIPFLWGFKDPRTSITLPVWLKIFPNAKLLRIQRHGMDVAASLRTRYRKNKPNLGTYSRKTQLGITWPARNRTIDAIRCDSLKGGVDIWNEYENALDHYLADIPAEQQMTLRYEDYLTDFENLHQQVADFAGVEAGTSLPEGISPDPSRAYAYRKNAEYLDAAEAMADILAGHGY